MDMLISFTFHSCYNIVAHKLVFEDEDFRVLENIKVNLWVSELFGIDIALLVNSQKHALLTFLKIVTSTAL